MRPPNKLGAGEALAGIRNGTLTCAALMDATLNEIRRSEPRVHAWVAIDEEGALRRATAADRVPRDQRGPLHGLPIGVKDNFDTDDFPTECGGLAWKGRQPMRNAAVVQLAIDSGAIVIGKTVTTEYALRHAGATRNPYASDHTPGGSSSGSAAAVAACMASIAIGSQTNGSVLRPASYCGVYGYKPTFGLLPRDGLSPIAPSLDTVGTFARDLEGIALSVEVLSKRASSDQQHSGYTQAGLQEAVTHGPHRAWHVGFCRSPVWLRCDADTREQLEAFAKRLRGAIPSVRLFDVELPSEFHRAYEMHMVIQDAGVARSLSNLDASQRALLSESLKENLRKGEAIPDTQLLAALEFQRWARHAMDAVMDSVDVMIGPAATGEAPRTLMDTGDPVMQTLWTFTGTPALSVPFTRGKQSLPIGLQVTARREWDARVLGFAAFLEAKGFSLASE